VRSTTGRISGMRVKKGDENLDWNSCTAGGLPSSDQAYTTTPCLAFIEFARRRVSRFRFSSASSCSRCYCSVKMGGICDTYPGFGWASREEFAGEMGKVEG
jgi:hypothetical protein